MGTESKAEFTRNVEVKWMRVAELARRSVNVCSAVGNSNSAEHTAFCGTKHETDMPTEVNYFYVRVNNRIFLILILRVCSWFYGCSYLSFLCFKMFSIWVSVKTAINIWFLIYKNAWSFLFTRLHQSADHD